MRSREYRVVRVGDQYYLQFKSWFHWHFACGYHRGAPGQFNYQYDKSANQFFPADSTLRGIEQERQHPTLPRVRVWNARRLRPKRPGPIAEIFEIQDIKKAVAEHRKVERPATEPYPLVRDLRALMVGA